jgi:hypothetical protein
MYSPSAGFRPKKTRGEKKKKKKNHSPKRKLKNNRVREQHPRAVFFFSFLFFNEGTAMPPAKPSIVSLVAPSFQADHAWQLLLLSLLYLLTGAFAVAEALRTSPARRGQLQHTRLSDTPPAGNGSGSGGGSGGGGGGGPTTAVASFRAAFFGLIVTLMASRCIITLVDFGSWDLSMMLLVMTLGPLLLQWTVFTLVVLFLAQCVMVLHGRGAAAGKRLILPFAAAGKSLSVQKQKRREEKKKKKKKSLLHNKLSR